MIFVAGKFLPLRITLCFVFIKDTLGRWKIVFAGILAFMSLVNFGILIAINVVPGKYFYAYQVQCNISLKL